MSHAQPILLFDGVCNLCSSSVQFVLARNKKENIQFASLQSSYARQKLKEAKLPANYTDSLVLVENGKYYVKSDAALQLAKYLTGFWKLASLLRIIPRFVRDPLYTWIAHNRYDWFGKSDACWIPSAKWKNRFLDHAEV